MRLSRRFKPVNMNGCVLYLPLYAYGANAQKAWDISGQGNHGVITSVGPGADEVLNPTEKITNGLFASDSDWNKGTGWTIASNKATKVAGTASDLEQDISVIAGETYLLSYSLSRSAGTFTPQLGGVDGTERSASGSYEEKIVAATTGSLKFQADASAAGSVNRVYCRKVDSSLVQGWKFNGVSSFVSIPDFLETGNSAKELSILIWYYPHILNRWLFSHSNGFTSAGWMIVKSSTNETSGVQVMVSTDGTLVAGTSKVYIGSQVTLSFRWHLAGFTFSSGVLNLYINGALDTNPTKLYDASITTIYDLNYNFLLGAFGSGAGISSPHLGSIGEALIFNRALSTQEHRDFFEMTRSRYGI